MPATQSTVRFGKPNVVVPNVVAATAMGSSVSPDGDELSIAFDTLSAESQAPQTTLSATTTVSFEVPIEAPTSAHRVRVDLDLRGMIQKSEGAHALLTIAIGDTVVTRAFELGAAANRKLELDLRESMPAHPGGRLVERVLVSISLAVGRQNAGEMALLVIDTVDLTVHAT